MVELAVLQLVLAVIDTNVITSALITRDHDSPTSRILRSMAVGGFHFVLSEALIAEYASVLHRRKILQAASIRPHDVDALITRLRGHAEVPRIPNYEGPTPPDPKDVHLWAILKSVEGTLLVSGDRRLCDATRSFAEALSPREFVDRYGL